MNYSTFAILKRTFGQARPYWGYITAIFICNFLASPISLLKPLALKILIDSGFGSVPVPSYISFLFPPGYDFSFITVVWISISLVLLIALIDNVYTVVIWILNTYTGEKLVRNLRYKLFDHIQRISLTYHDRKGTADSVYRIQNDTSSIRTLIINNISPIMTSVITLVGMLVIMFTINWRFAFITCCLSIPILILTRVSSLSLKKTWKKVKQYESNAMSVIQEVLTSLRVVKAFGQEGGENDRFMSKADIAMKGQLKVARTGALYHFFVGMSFASATALFIYFGATFVHTGHMTLGELTMVMAYLGQIYTPLEKLTRNFNQLQSATTSLERVYSLLDEEKEVKEMANPVHVARAKGSIEFRNVCFSYDKEVDVLNNISFQIKPGERVGIMGTTGAGKSTLINLLTRFYDPTSGEILMDGKGITHYRLSDYRNQFSIVPQEPILFSSTIGENIAYGLPNAGQNEIVEAAKMANAHDFIISSKDGYDSMVGERGLSLSGGERQRIAIARAFIRNAPVLILDEPTSSLDINTENLIIEAMDRLMEGRTTFLITHRLNTLDSCDLIMHLEKGSLVEIVNNKEPGAFARKKSGFMTSV